jgi:hypothetical protein
MTDTPNGPPDRRLRLVRPGDVPATTVQIADFPDAYAVRRGGAAEAILHRSNTGLWLIMYGHVPDAAEGAEQWLGSAVLSSEMTQQQAAAASIELVDATLLREVAPSWPDLLARLIDAGPTVADVGRLHAPDALGYCIGDNAVVPDTRRPWVTCQTVRLLAATVGLELVDLARKVGD